MQYVWWMLVMCFKIDRKQWFYLQGIQPNEKRDVSDLLFLQPWCCPWTLSSHCFAHMTLLGNFCPGVYCCSTMVKHLSEITISYWAQNKGRTFKKNMKQQSTRILIDLWWYAPIKTINPPHLPFYWSNQVGPEKRPQLKLNPKNGLSFFIQINLMHMDQVVVIFSHETLVHIFWSTLYD